MRPRAWTRSAPACVALGKLRVHGCARCPAMHAVNTQSPLMARVSRPPARHHWLRLRELADRRLRTSTVPPTGFEPVSPARRRFQIGDLRATPAGHTAPAGRSRHPPNRLRAEFACQTPISNRRSSSRACFAASRAIRDLLRPVLCRRGWMALPPPARSNRAAAAGWARVGTSRRKRRPQCGAGETRGGSTLASVARSLPVQRRNARCAVRLAERQMRLRKLPIA